jgi:hypothetical protein
MAPRGGAVANSRGFHGTRGGAVANPRGFHGTYGTRSRTRGLRRERSNPMPPAATLRG